MNPMDSRRRRQIIIRGALFLAFLAALVFLTIRYGPEVTRLFSRPYRTREYLRSFGLAAPLIYILFQVIQVVVAFIPGEVVQVAGGFVFGTILGTVYSVVGAALGTLIAFLTARALGFSLVRILVPRETFDRLHSLINSPRSDVTVFILFLMPGVPKDPLTYIAGLTPMRPLRFLVISMLGRFPSLLGSAYVGSHLAKKNYWPVMVVSAAALVLFILGFLFRKKIYEFIRQRSLRG
jgi:uncharacterized membrane protein YdjX (TVP38/TMEM64 family)